MRRHLRRILGIAATAVLLGGLAADPGLAADSTLVFQGTVTDRTTGLPVAGACVATVSAYLVGCTDDQGHYEIRTYGTFSTGTFSLRAQASGYQPTSSLNMPSLMGRWWTGGSLPITADLKLARATGTIANGLAPATMRVVSVEGDWKGSTVTGTLAGVPVGRYRVAFSDATHAEQWVPGGTPMEQATLFEVTADGVTTVTDTLLPLGTVEVHVVDDGTGQPISRGCVNSNGITMLCDRPDGVYRFTDLAPGSRSFGVAPPGSHAAPDPVTTIVQRGEVNVVTMRLAKAARLKVRIEDRAQPGYHPAACVMVLPPTLQLKALAFACNTVSDGTDDSIVLGSLPAGEIQLFAMPYAAGYGAQWVGATGGVGDSRQAQRITLTPGVESTITVRLDPAGSISGRITDRDTGTPVRACPRPIPDPPLDGWNWDWNCSDASGDYRIDGLGPYAWSIPFLTASEGSATAWNGGATQRLTTTPIVVKAGQTTVADQRIGRERKLSVRVVRDGVQVNATVIAFDAATGDVISTSWSGDPLGVRGLPQQRPVVLAVNESGGTACWYRAVPSRRRSTGYVVEATVTSLTIELSAQCVAATPDLLSVASRRTMPSGPWGSVFRQAFDRLDRAAAASASAASTSPRSSPNGPTRARLARVKP
ncbi:hypothetical protein F4553_004356 [Allocatelliglobosispora scoriae]|uniref:Carboxypeptidase regulatory-like domain-containing protein n=1 Tax=Allocatelliglobosispora scoriae TaxID=643052 RepID=A0A841BPH6_9ACTN|nr:hypothetical protein [Allocatelliglobosispora scoriae]MBB5870977.1 hypothetical protein [Allocatelliglobosispora scoriae]